MKKISNEIYPLLINGFLSSVFGGGILMLFGETIVSTLIFISALFIGFCSAEFIDILIDAFAEEKNKSKYKLIKTILWLGTFFICLLLAILL